MIRKIEMAVSFKRKFIYWQELKNLTAPKTFELVTMQCRITTHYYVKKIQVIFSQMSGCYIDNANNDIKITPRVIS